VFPVLWTSVEWLVGHQGDIRFPWLGLGTSLTGFPTVIQAADVIGARGVTLLLAVANTALAFAWIERRNAKRATVLVGAVAVGLSAAIAYGLVREATVGMRPLGSVTVLQPNVPVNKKHDRTLHDSIVRSTVEFSAVAAERTKPQLLVWPESALPDYLFRHEEWEPLIAARVVQSGVPLVTGGLHVVWGETEDEYDYYNSAFLYDATGDRRSHPVYHKRYLVPLVERVPFVNPRWFELRWLGGFSTGGVGHLYEIEIGQFGIMICYESAFESLSRDYRRRGADFLVNVTNDDWFGNTTAPFQHAAHLVLRAIENRISIVRAANSGISEFVDPLGRESKRTRLGEKTFAADVVQTSDVLTIYTRFGDWVGFLVLCFTATLIGYSWWQKR
jgi:apolipoprotein N-acyltransferase